MRLLERYRKGRDAQGGHGFDTHLDESETVREKLRLRAILAEMQADQAVLAAYEQELSGRTPTPDELAECERRRELVREHGREFLRCANGGDGQPPGD